MHVSANGVANWCCVASRSAEPWPSRVRPCDAVRPHAGVSAAYRDKYCSVFRLSAIAALAEAVPLARGCTPHHCLFPCCALYFLSDEPNFNSCIFGCVIRPIRIDMHFLLENCGIVGLAGSSAPSTAAHCPDTRSASVSPISFVKVC